MVNSVEHVYMFYSPIPSHCWQLYPMRSVKIKTELGEMEIKIGDRVVYKGKQLNYPERFDYGQLKQINSILYVTNNTWLRFYTQYMRECNTT